MPSLTRSGRPSAVAAASRSPSPSRGWSSATPEVRTRSCSSTDALGVDTATDLHRKKSTRRRNASTGRDEAGRPGCRRSPCHAPPHTSPLGAGATAAPAWGPRVRVRLAGGLLAGCLVLTGCVSVRPLDLVPLERVAQTSLVLDANGRAVAALHGPEDRTAVGLDKVSRWLRLAVVDTEDARFWRHGGVDWLAVVRAAARDLERRRVVEGGSTITQQYVKNNYVSGDRTLRRKLAEAGHAWGLEQRNDKRAILEAYLNTVYFGQGAYGVEAAAQTYFSTGADRLSLTQAALLAGLIRAPAAYDPFRHPRAALARRASVLARAVRARAAAASLGLRPGDPAAAAPAKGRRAQRSEAAQRAPWFVGWVLDQLLDPADRRFDVLGTSRKARTDRVFTGGLRITTTVDLKVQAAAERAVAAVAGRRARDPYGALAAVEPGTGAVRAMVGGRSWEDDARFGRVNLATGAGGGGRPAGSAFKAFALVAALERGIPPEAVFAAPDRLMVGRRGHGPDWRVANYEGHGFGKATLRTATALSINTVNAGLLLRLGGGDPDRGARAVVEAAARMGVESPLRAVPSAVLGTGEVTPLEMAAAYATLAADGRRAAPFGVARITGPDGRVLYQARQGAGQVVKPSVAAIATNVLRGVVDRGTGVRGRSAGRPPPRRARPRTRPTPGSWASPRRWPRPSGSATPRARCRWCRRGSPAECRAGPGRRPSGPGSCAWPWPANRPGGSPGPTPAWSSWPLDLKQGCLPNHFTPASAVASVVYLKASAPTRACRKPDRPVAGVVPAVVGVPLARAAGWLEEAGLSLVQRLRVEDAAAPGTVLAQSPAGGAARPAGAPVELTVAVDAQGAGGLGVTLVPEVLGQPEETARQLLDQAGLTFEVRPGCDTDAARAAAQPGRVWRSGPAPRSQATTGSKVRLWVNPPGCPPPATTTTRATPTPTSLAER